MRELNTFVLTGKEAKMVDCKLPFSSCAKNIHCVTLVTVFTIACYTQATKAQQVSNIFVDKANGHVSWTANGVQWYSVVELDVNFGDSIPIISIELETGNEVALIEDGFKNCFYNGSLADSSWQPINQTQAFINLCHSELPFTGFVSDSSGLYTIEEESALSGQLVMEVDDPMIPLATPNETNVGNNGGNGSGKLIKPDIQVERASSPDKFPNAQVVVEPEFVNTYGNPGFIYRIANTLAFTNFVFEQSGIKPIHLVSIDVLNGALNQNGGIGSIHHKLLNLRRATVQAGSADVSVLLVGGDTDATYIWGWAFDAKACELQIAVAEANNLNTIDIGKSSAFVIDLPSLIQRGWIFAHEFAHVIGASKHINGDPLMDGWFQYINTLSGYVAGCDATTQIFHSCAYDNKTLKVTDYYVCE